MQASGMRVWYWYGWTRRYQEPSRCCWRAVELKSISTEMRGSLPRMPAGILSRAQPDRGILVRKPDGQDLRSSGYGAAVILRRAIPSCDVQSAERARVLGTRILSGLSRWHEEGDGKH